MADTKISALTAVGTPAGADEFPVNQAGTSKKETLTQVATFTWNAPVWAGGTASANTWPKFSTGTLLTTPEVGALELDANCLYGTTDAGNRGVIPVQHFIRQHASYTLTNTTSAQKLFDGSTNGALTLETGVYKFTCQMYLTSMSSGSANNAQFQILGGGTATMTNVLYVIIGRDGGSDSAQASAGAMSSASSSASSMITGVANSTLCAVLRGTFELSGAGTIIPSVALATGAAAVVNTGSFFECERIGDATMTTVGQWT